MDRVLIGGFFIPLVRSGKLRQLLEAAELGRTESNRQTSLRKVCEINISVSDDYERARIFPKHYIAHMLLVLDALGFSDAEFRALNIETEAIKNIKARFTAGGTIEDVAPIITDAMWMPVSSPADRAIASKSSKRCVPMRGTTALIKYAWQSSGRITNKRSPYWQRRYCRRSFSVETFVRGFY